MEKEKPQQEVAEQEPINDDKKEDKDEEKEDEEEKEEKEDDKTKTKQPRMPSSIYLSVHPI